MAKRLPKRHVARKPVVAPRPVVAPKPRVLYLCIAETTVISTKHECNGRFGPGQIVDLEELIGGKLKLRGEVRPGTFKAIEPPISRTGEGDGK